MLQLTLPLCRPRKQLIGDLNLVVWGGLHVFFTNICSQNSRYDFLMLILALIAEAEPFSRRVNLFGVLPVRHGLCIRFILH